MKHKKSQPNNSSRVKENKFEPNYFTYFSTYASNVIGHPYAFAFAILSVLIWAMIGPYFHFSGPWQLVINVTLNIFTFLIVFLIQNTQNRDTLMLKIKLDELIRSNEIAKNSAIDLSSLSDAQLKKMEEKYKEISSSNDSVPKV